MGNPIDRRAFLTGKKQELTDTIPQVNNGTKYVNKSLPSQLNRTNSGINQYTGVFGDAQKMHLLRRLTFGVKKAHFDQIKNMTMSQAVDFLIDNPVQPTTTPLNSYQQDYADTLGCPSGASWVNHAAPFNDDFALNYFRTYWSFLPWWYNEMINQRPHILEKLNLFWVNHFSTQMADFNLSKAVFQHHKLIRQQSLGNFKTMVKQVTIDPHMLFFLNGAWNNKWAPDENYSRELQELYTVGKGPGSGYTENDVKEAARILTGWRVNSNSNGSYNSYFDANWHDTGNKQFSSFYANKLITGKTGLAGAGETDELLTMIFETQEVAKYVVRRLYRWFVYYVIDNAVETNVIAPLATIFRNSNYDIPTLLKALFKSEHFFDPLNAGCMIKSPVDFYISFIREFNLALPTTPLNLQYYVWRHFTERTAESDQSPGDPPNVAGWRAYYQDPVYYQSWITSDTIQRRSRAINEYIMSGTYYYTFKIQVNVIDYAKQFVNPGDPNLLVQQLISYLLPKDLSDNQKTFMKSILLSNQTSDSYWTNAWNAYIGSPNTANTTIVQTRLQTLLDYITGLEEYQLC